MKRTYLTTMICCLVLVASVRFGQKYRGNLACGVGDVSFVCPKGFKLVPVQSDLKLALLFSKQKHKEDDLGLFVALPEPGIDEQTLLGGVAKTTVARIFPTESQEYEWRRVNLANSVSKFETSSGMIVGFNGSLAILIKYHRLRVKDKDTIVGYVSGAVSGTEAKEFFERTLDADARGGCEASVEVIYSITGERITTKNQPCALEVNQTK